MTVPMAVTVIVISKCDSANHSDSDSVSGGDDDDDDDDGDDGDVGHSLISTVQIFLIKRKGSAYQVIQCPWHIFGRVLLTAFTYITPHDFPSVNIFS